MARCFSAKTADLKQQGKKANKPKYIDGINAF